MPLDIKQIVTDGRDKKVDFIYTLAGRTAKITSQDREHSSFDGTFDNQGNFVEGTSLNHSYDTTAATSYVYLDGRLQSAITRDIAGEELTKYESTYYPNRSKYIYRNWS